MGSRRFLPNFPSYTILLLFFLACASFTTTGWHSFSLSIFLISSSPIPSLLLCLVCSLREFYCFVGKVDSLNYVYTLRQVLVFGFVPCEMGLSFFIEKFQACAIFCSHLTLIITGFFLEKMSLVSLFSEYSVK